MFLVFEALVVTVGWWMLADGGIHVLHSDFSPAGIACSSSSAKFLHTINDNREPDWLGELAKGGEALQREAMRIVKAAEEMAASGQARPLTRRIVRAMGAGIRELAVPEPIVHELTLATTVTSTADLTGVGTITASGSIAFPPMRFAGEGTAQHPDLVERNIGRILALVVLAIVTSGLLGVQGPGRATVDHYLTVLSFALPIAVLICTKQNKQ